jgi:RNA polymerase sigma-70 factor (ECF subfamily)
VNADAGPDVQLARELMSGSEQAFERFVDVYRAKLFQYSYLMCGHREDAEEVAQETLLKVFESLDQLREPERLRAWVFRIAKNACLMKRRKSVFAPQIELSLEDLGPRDPDGGQGLLEIADWSAIPETAAAEAETRTIIEQAIRKLPDIYRAVVLLRDVEELTTEEAARVLEVSEDVVKTRLHRARLALRQELDRHFQTPKGAKVS